MTHPTLADRLLEMEPCDDNAALWERCERGDWMLWVAGRVGVEWCQIIRAASECVREALRAIPGVDERAWWAIETGEERCHNDATPSDLSLAKMQAHYASDSADNPAAGHVAAAAAHAIGVPAHAHLAAEFAARAMALAADTSDRSDDYSPAYAASLAASAAHVRRIIPWSEVERALVETLSREGRPAAHEQR